jgi:hypothetical protein
VDNGVHSFTVTLATAGAAQTVTATDTVTSTVQATQQIAVTPAAAATFVVSGFPSSITAGTAGNVTVTAKDAFGNIATGYVGTVHFTSTDGQATLPADYAFTSGDAGVHTFSVTLKTAGSGAVTATDTVTGSITGTQSGISVNGASASVLLVSGFPTSISAGAAGNVTVTAKDAFGNTATGYSGTVHFTSTDGQATLPANYAFTSADAGVHTFSATLKTVGSQSITATDTVTGTIAGTQNGITVNPAAASTFVVSGFPSPITAGVAGNVTVTAKDAFGNIATGYAGTVHFTSTDGQATLPVDYAFTSGDAGVHTFSVTLKTVGSRAVTATDTVTGTIAGTQSGITVNPAAASVLLVSGFPTSISAGVAGNVTVTAKDAFGNTATGYSGTVHFTSADGQATLPANYAFTSADAGVHTFSATLKTVGSQSITATDTVTGTIAGTQSSITVNPAAASKFVVSGFPSPATAGVAGNVTVTAKDAFGNTATGYRGTVHFTSTDGQATLPANYTFTSSDPGAHTFSVTLKTAGSQSISAQATGVTTGTQSGITVNPAAAGTFLVSGFPSPVTAGAAGNVTVTARDAFGNTATGYGGTVHFTSTDGQATLPANYAFVSTDAGVHTFSVTLKTAGSRSITATDTVTGTIAGTQSGITVNPAAASTFVVSGFPSPVTAGVAGNVTVTAKDAFGNTATGYRGTVHFTSTDTQAALPADYGFKNSDAGVHAFSVTLKTSGSRAITATDTVTSSITGTQSAITVNAAAAASIRISAPANVSRNTQFSFTITMVDAFGNVATGYRGTVHFTSSDGAATLPANYTFTAGDAGVHTFTATMRTSGSQTLKVTDTNNSSITGSQSIQVAMIDLPALPDIMSDIDNVEIEQILLPGSERAVELIGMLPNAANTIIGFADENDGILTLLGETSPRNLQGSKEIRALDRIYGQIAALPEEEAKDSPVLSANPATAASVALLTAMIGNLHRAEPGKESEKSKRSWLSWLSRRKHYGNS